MIEKYIRQLLEKHDEVTVPDLGTFKAVYSSAQIRGNEVAPPNKKILFNEDVQFDLEQRLQKNMMEAEYISQEDFDEQLRVFLSGLKTALEDEGKFLIKGLGHITKAPDGSLSFSQDEAENFLEDTFGLAPVAADPTVAREVTAPSEDESSTLEDDSDAESPAEDESPEEAEEPVAAAADEEDTKKEPQPEVHEDMEDEHKEEPYVEEKEEKKKSDLVAWLIIIPLVTIFAFLLYIYINRDDNEELQALLDQQAKTEQPAENTEEQPAESEGVGQQDGETASDNNAETTPTEDGTSSETETAPTESKIPTSPAPTASQNTGTVSQDGVLSGKTGRFYILIGSYSTLEKAQTKRGELGAGALIIPAYPSVNNYRVAVESFDSERKAYNRRNELRAGEYPNAWVLEY